MNFFPKKMRKRFQQRGINERKEEREGEGEAVLTVSQSVSQFHTSAKGLNNIIIMALSLSVFPFFYFKYNACTMLASDSKERECYLTP